MLVNPDSFSHLPEYIDDHLLSPLRRGSVTASLASSLPGSERSCNDPNIMILPRFEDVACARRGSKDLPKVKMEEEFHIPVPMDIRYLDRFKDVVWRQLVPVETQQLLSGKPTSVLVFEEEMGYYPAVCAS